MTDVVRKIVQARKTLEGIASDITELLTMAELSIPIAENVVDRVKLRICEVENLFSSEEKNK